MRAGHPDAAGDGGARDRCHGPNIGRSRANLASFSDLLVFLIKHLTQPERGAIERRSSL
jgi:hypothetical protein